jgi:hypothetical protein
MKRKVALIIGVAAGFMASVWADVAPLRLDGDVEVKTKTHEAKLGVASANRDASVTKQLSVRVRNISAEPQKASVRYWLFGRDSKNALEVIGGGEVEAMIPAKSTERVEIEPVTFEFKEPRSIQPTRVKGGNVLPLKQIRQAKPVSSGVKYAGFGVQVLKGSEVMANQFSEETYMSKVGAGRAKAGEKFEAPAENK